MQIHRTFALENLSFAFNKSTHLFFNNLSVEFKPHTLNFIQGKNGSGKSTLLNILQGNFQSTNSIRGTLYINNTPHSLDQRTLIHSKIGMIPQHIDSMLVNHYSFLENLQFANIGHIPTLRQLPSHKPLPSFLSKYNINYSVPISSLSGGQRQILSILMMLQKPRNVLLLDEPTAALDEENTTILMDFLQELSFNEKITIVLIVHDHDIVTRYCPKEYNRLIVQEDGQRTLEHITV